MKFLSGGSLHSDVRCSKLLYLIFVVTTNPMKCRFHLSVSYLIFSIAFFYLVPVFGQRDPYNLRKPKGSEDVMIGPFSGTFTMGTADDPYGVKDAPKKEVTIKKFLIDESEVSNKKYRRFVKYVRD